MVDQDHEAAASGAPTATRRPLLIALGVGMVVALVGGYLLVTQADSRTARPSNAPASEGASNSILARGDIVNVIPKDAIPAIDEPRFEAVQEVNWLAEKEPVIAIELTGEERAYPLQIMTWHEIVNDEIGGMPIAVTFCPLCNTALAYKRPEIDGSATTFGTSGKLINSNLLMYDRATESLWPQVSGEALTGPLVGTRLTRIPARIVSWREFKSAFPGGQVLSRDTGHDRDYGENPYPGYDDVDSAPFLFRGETDGRLAAVERVLGIQGGDKVIAFPYFRLEEKSTEGASVVNATVGPEKVAVFWKAGTTSALDAPDFAASRDVGAAVAYSRVVDGRVIIFAAEGGNIVDVQTRSTWNLLGRAVDGRLAGSSLKLLDAIDSFWFDWAAFHPDSEIWRRQ